MTTRTPSNSVRGRVVPVVLPPSLTVESASKPSVSLFFLVRQKKEKKSEMEADQEEDAPLCVSRVLDRRKETNHFIQV